MQTSRDPMLCAKACGALMKKLLTFSPLKAAAIVTLLVTVLAGIVITDGVYASYFFYLNWSRLQGAADVAAHAGVKFLPRDRERALSTAKAYAEMNGVGRGEIVSASVSADDRAITIKLARAIPFYLRGFAVGPSGRQVKATGTAHLPYHHPTVSFMPTHASTSLESTASNSRLNHFAG
jgi:hypothetical protein